MVRLARDVGPIDPTLPWRVGGSLGITVYAALGEEHSDDDIFLGTMDTRELAEIVVALHNTSIRLGM